MTWVIAGLMQGQTEVFAERMQGQHLYILGYSASVFGNSASMLIVMLGLSGHSNGYRTTVAVARNSSCLFMVAAHSWQPLVHGGCLSMCNYAILKGNSSYDLCDENYVMSSHSHAGSAILP